MKSSMMKLAPALAAMVVCGSAVAAGNPPPPSPGKQATFAVTAVVPMQCVVGNTTEMKFGRLNMLSAVGGISSADSTATATFDATCTNGTVTPELRFTSLNGGANGFQMLGGANSTDILTYSLADSSGTALTAGTPAAFPGFDADGTVKTLTVAGRIVAADKIGKTVGDYSDTVKIEITWAL